MEIFHKILLLICTNGSATAKSTIASNYKYKLNNNEQKEEVYFLEFNIFGRSAEIAHQYLKKCSKVLLVGRLIYETWTETDEKSRTKYSLRVETMKMLNNTNNNDIVPIYLQEVLNQKPVLKLSEEDSLTEIDEKNTLFKSNRILDIT